MGKIDITGLPPAAVFAALYNYAYPLNAEGVLHRDEISPASAFHMLKHVGFKLPQQMDEAQVRSPHLLIINNSLYGFYGRAVPVDLRGTAFNPVLYNGCNGDGAAEFVVECLRNGEEPPRRRLPSNLVIDV